MKAPQVFNLLLSTNPLKLEFISERVVRNLKQSLCRYKESMDCMAKDLGTISGMERLEIYFELLDERSLTYNIHLADKFTLAKLKLKESGINLLTENAR